MSAANRLAELAQELGILSEELAEEAYERIENETLKQVAIAAGIDHTIDPTVIIEQLGEALQHERRRVAKAQELLTSEGYEVTL